LYEAKQANRHLDQLVVVEGYMDVIALAQADIKFAVATLGTATTTEQAKKLVRTCEKITFCFDGDRAGRSAAWKALENVLPVMREGLSLNFLFLPDGHDPDTYVRDFGRDAFLKELENASPLSSFFFKNLSEDLNLEHLDARATLAKRAQPLINRLPIGVFRDLMMSELASIVKTDVKQLQQRIVEQKKQQTRRQTPRRESQPQGTTQQTINNRLLKQALTYLLHFPKLAERFTAIEQLSEQGSGSALLIDILETLHTNPELNTSSLLERFRDHQHSQALSRLALSEMLLDDEEKAAHEFLSIMYKLSAGQNQEQRLNQLMHKSRNGELDSDEKRELAQLLSERV